MSGDTIASTSVSEFPRRYVAADACFDRWEAAEPYYRKLTERLLDSPVAVERWLLDFSELDSVFDEEGTSRYVAMTCQTDDAEREARFLKFITEVKPRREPWHHALRKKFVEAAGRIELPRRRYEVLERSARNAIEIYRDESIPLQTEDEQLRQQYQKITGAMTCEYRGQEMTLPQLARFQEETDRAVREATWRLTVERFARDADALDEVYVKMVGLRDRIARNAACGDYRAYAFKAMERFDYTPQDCLAFHDAIEKVVVPAAGILAERRRRKLGLTALRPWDVAVDPEGRPPLRPFETDEQLAAGCGRVFSKVNAELGRTFEHLRSGRMLDLGSRKGKAPGGYQTTYEERRMPFIFMNAVGTEADVRTLLHEGGHAFHTWACRQEPLGAYRQYPTEFAEVASMGMELLSLPHLGEFYGEETRRAVKRFLEGIVNFFPWMARVDAYQHHVYTHMGQSLAEWKEEWVRLSRRFNPELDWSGIEVHDRNSWHRKLHFFEVPFYYVEYGIAQLGALQVWMNARRDYEQAVAQYRNGLALGGSRPLPELFAAAGLTFDFSEKTLRPLIEAVMEEIAGL